MDIDSNFENAPVKSSEIPTLNHEGFEMLDRKNLYSKLVSSVIFTAILIIALVVLFNYVGSSLILFSLIVLILLLQVLGTVSSFVTYKWTGYQLRDLDASFRSGLLTLDVVTVPYIKVQEVSVNSGLINKMFGLASLDIKTAGGSVFIPGIEIDLAKRLRTFVIKRAAELSGEMIEKTYTQQQSSPATIGDLD